MSEANVLTEAQIYIALLKFDFFFFLGFTVQFVVVVRDNTSPIETYLTIAAIPVTIFILLAAAWFTRRESTAGMCATIFLYFAAMAYFLFKLVRMYDAKEGRVLDYIAARKSLTTFAVITLLLLIMTIINCVWCMANFNKGLKPHIQRRRVIGPEDKNYAYEGGRRHGSMGSAHAMNAIPNRMTID
jgi:NADH:ubiquinone oxidoreductase subunit 6 (subunit J)